MTALLDRIKEAGPDAPVSRAEATALIAPRTMDGRDTVRGARNRVGVQLDRAIIGGRTGHDIFSGGISPRPDGTFTADELGRWANRRYDNKFSDIPRKPRAVDCDCRETLELGAKPNTALLPGDKPGLQALVLRLHAEIEEFNFRERRLKEMLDRALGARFATKKSEHT